MAAERLAAAGVETTLLDEKLAWEKPCGGGLTTKAYLQYPFLLDNDTPKKLVRAGRMAEPGAGSVEMKLEQPLLVYARKELNGLMLRRAERAGARIEKTRVTGLKRNGTGWVVSTRGGDLEADYAVVAMGARNPLREAGTEFTSGDTMTALGYFIPSDQDHIDIQFYPDFEGYIWLFPRCGHLSAGIAGKGEPAQRMRERLESYLREKGLDWREAPFFGHVIPALEAASFQRNRVAGDGWCAVGDAAGLVDPLTGEGLYYAMRSAELACGTLLDGGVRDEERAAVYRARLREDFLDDLTYGATLARRFFRGQFLWKAVTGRMIQFMRTSAGVRTVVADLFAGTQDYLSLKPRLKSILGSFGMPVS